MQTLQRTCCAIVAAAAAWLALPAARAIADEVRLRTGGGAAIGTLPSSGNSVGVGLGAAANAGASGSGSAGLDLNPPGSTDFQTSPLTVPDGLDRFSIRGGDSKGQVSVIYKFVKTKF
jgi:hypothetical protein